MKQKLLEKLLWLPVLVFLATLTSWPQVSLGTAEIESPDLNVILKHLEHAQHQDPAQSRRYEVMREYKVFHGDDKQPTSEVMAQINFVPPDIKTYKMGNPRGEKMVRELLDRETESAKKGRSSEINRMNYDFVFLRHENFGIVPEYVLRIVPKPKDKYLLRGWIWVDACAHLFRVFVCCSSEVFLAIIVAPLDELDCRRPPGDFRTPASRSASRSLQAET